MKLRITGGEFRGRLLSVPKSDLIRPTQDRVRESLFNILAPEIPGAVFLDLFSGSGAIGLEALSRGAATVTFVERDRRHAAVIGENLKTLGAHGQVHASDAYAFLATYAGEGFTMAFADPPYALGEDKGYAAVLKTLAARNVVRPEGLFIAEMTAAQQPETVEGWELLRDRTYGHTRIAIWRRAQAAIKA